MRIQKTMPLITWLIILLTTLTPSFSNADTDLPATHLSPLLTEMSRMHAPTQMLQAAIGTLSGVHIGTPPAGAATYDRSNSRIYLDTTFQNPVTGSIKSPRDLSSGQLATLIHELFHCYFQNIAQAHSTHFYTFFSSQAESLYDSHGDVIHEEAYALYLESLMGQHITTYRIMESKTPEARDLLRKRKPFTSLYELTFTESIYGYYLNSYGELITSSVNLPTDDRNNILTSLLENKMNPSFEIQFAEANFKAPYVTFIDINSN